MRKYTVEPLYNGHQAGKEAYKLAVVERFRKMIVWTGAPGLVTVVSGGSTATKKRSFPSHFDLRLY